MKRRTGHRGASRRLSRGALLLGASLAILFLHGPARAAEPDIAGLLGRIGSSEDSVRMAARAEAARIGAPAVAPLAGLLQGDNREGATTAYHALRGIVHRAGRPGADPAERRAVAGELAKLLAPSRPARVKRDALFLISFIGGDDDVPAVARCLQDDGLEVAETARLTLERLPGAAATRALIEAARSGPAERRPDFLFSLSRKSGPEVIPFLLENAAAGGEEVRVAAFQALAHLGAAEAVAPLRAALAAAAEPLRQRLCGELLRLADEVFEAGRFGLAHEIYVWSLHEASADFQRERALARLCRPGDIYGAPLLLSALEDPSERVRQRALVLLGQIDGATVKSCLRSGYEEASDSVRPDILRALVRLDRDAAAPLLERAMGGERVELAITARDLLGRLDDPAMESKYLEVARAGSKSVRPTALRGYLLLAGDALEAGKKAKALEMFTLVLALAREAEPKRQAVAALGRIGDPSVIDRLSPLLADPALANDAARAQITLATTLAAAGSVDRAASFLSSIVAGKFPRDVILAAADALKKIGRDPQKEARRKGFVLDWWLIGPIRDPEGKGMGEKIFPEERIRLDTIETIGPRRYRWQRLRDLCLDGKVDLVPIFRRSQNVIAYGYTLLESERDQDVLLKLGSDDGIACWVNDERVHFNPGTRGWLADQDVVKAHLRKGKNKILIKVSQGGGDWVFSFRVTRPDGTPLALPASIP